MKKYGAFSLSETILAMSIIGILAMTMITLNKMDASRTTEIRLQQAETSLVSWGKALTKFNETGLGAYTKIQSQEDLENSLFGINFNAGYIQDSNYKFIGNNKDQTTLQTSNNPIKNTIILKLCLDGVLSVAEV